MIYRNIARHRLFDQLVCLADPVRHLTLDHFLSVKAFHRHLGVRSYDNAVRLTDFFIRQHILGAAGPPCLYFYEAVLRLRSFLDPLRSHISMCDPGRTGCNSKNLKISCRFLICISQSFVDITLLLIRLVNDFQELIHTLRVSKIVCKVLVHQKYRQLAQDIQMHVVFCIRRRDQEHQCDRLAVERIELHAVLYYHGRKSRLCHRIAFPVRNRNAFSDPRSTLFFPCIHLSTVCLSVIDLSAFDHQVDDLVKRLALRLRSSRKGNAPLIQQICDPHS